MRLATETPFKRTLDSLKSTRKHFYGRFLIKSYRSQKVRFGKRVEHFLPFWSNSIMKTTSITLGISPGTRSMGLALIQDGELVEWSVKTYKGSWTNSKLKDILYVLKTFIEEHEVTTIGLKKPDVFRTSTALEQLISELRVLCQRSSIVLSMFSLKTLKAQYSDEKGFTKANMIKRVASQFPELYFDYNKEQKHRNSYYTKMFEAVAAAQIASVVHL